MSASLLIWGQIHSFLCILCCCAPVYGALHPDKLWNRISSKCSASGQRFRAKRGMEHSALQHKSRQNLPLDPYFQGEGWFGTEDHTGSTRCLVSSDVRRAASYVHENHPAGPIKVDRCVNIDYPLSHQTHENGMGHSPEKRLLRPIPSHHPPLRVPQDV